MSTETMITETAAPAAEAPVAAPAGQPPAEGTSGAQDAGTDQVAERVAAEAPEAEGDKPTGAPEKYEDFTAPEGVAFDSTVMEQFAEAARELNLPQDAAQKMVDKMAPIMAQRQVEQLETMRTEWHAQSSTDKEFGGEKLTESMTQAKLAIETFATPEFKTLLNESGLGNHPEVVRFMVRAGKAISEDKIVTGGQPASAATSRAERLYGAKGKAK